MGQLKKHRFKYSFCFVTGLVIGILIGASVLCILVSYRMDMFHQRIAYLESMIQDKKAQLEQLEKTIDTRSLILKNIEIVLIFNGDEIDKINIEKAVKEKYRSLLGKEVEKIDTDIVAEVVDNRIMNIEGRKYQLHVNKLVLTETLKICITIESIS